MQTLGVDDWLLPTLGRTRNCLTPTASYTRERCAAYLLGGTVKGQNEPYYYASTG